MSQLTPTQALQSQSPRLAYKVPEFAALLGISHATVYNLIQRDQLQTIKIGRSTRITQEAVDDFMRRAAGA